MQVQPQIVLREVPDADAVQARVEEMIEKLERVAPRLIACRVLVERPHLRHREGNRFRVRIDATIPGREVVIAREPGDDDAHEDVGVALRDAFDAARRRLEDAVQEQRGEVKAHVEPFRGRVVRLQPEEGFGFLAAADGHEVYFHRRSVDGSFDELAVGSPVSFTEETGREGLQATWVKRGAGPAPVAD
jgi:cold shock CspA family protein/ribosome-associated translation inhibitor RaiA